MDGVGKSPFFDIGPDVFVKALKVTMDSGLYGQRCGVAVEVHSGRTSSSTASVITGARAWSPVAGGEPQDASKGWHDAGDYGKYVNSGAFSLGMMLQAFEQWPDRLSEVELAIPEGGRRACPTISTSVRSSSRGCSACSFPTCSVAVASLTQSFDAMIVAGGVGRSQPALAGGVPSPRRTSPP